MSNADGLKRRSTGSGSRRVRPHWGARVRAQMIHAQTTAARWGIAVPLALGALALGCDGTQSALDPAGRQADELARVFWWMTGGSLVIWLIVMGIALYAAYSPERSDLTGPRRLIVWGGVIVPTAVLTLVLCLGLALIPRHMAPSTPSRLQVHVTGEQYWWRVKYLSERGAPVELANEIRLPVGEDVDFLLDSRDVIHSFWIPSLGGKVDMI